MCASLKDDIVLSAKNILAKLIDRQLDSKRKTEIEIRIEEHSLSIAESYREKDDYRTNDFQMDTYLFCIALKLGDLYVHLNEDKESDNNRVANFQKAILHFEKSLSTLEYWRLL